MEKALESLKQLPQGYKKQQFDFFLINKLFWETKGINYMLIIYFRKNYF